MRSYTELQHLEMLEKQVGSLKPDEARANQFGLDLNSFENRGNIRALFITSKTQDQLLPGVVEYMLDQDLNSLSNIKTQ